MIIRTKSDNEAVGEVITNHSMTIWEACELAEVDTEGYDVEADLWMDYRDPAAVALGRKGGSVKSDAKTAAARKNAEKAGRPAKSNEYKIHLNIEEGTVEATEIRYATRLSGARQSARRALNKWAMEAIIFQRIGEDDAENTGYERVEILK